MDKENKDLKEFNKQVDSLGRIKGFNSLHSELDLLYIDTTKVVADILRKRTLSDIERGERNLMIGEKIDLLEKCEAILHKKINYRREFYNEAEKKKTFDQSVSLEKYRDFLVNKISELKQDLQKEDSSRFHKNKLNNIVPRNPYKHIFKGDVSFLLFLELHKIYKDRPNPLANYSLIFRMMKKDGGIVCGNKVYIEFLAENYNVHIDDVKRFSELPVSKTDTYKAIKENTIAPHE